MKGLKYQRIDGAKTMPTFNTKDLRLRMPSGPLPIVLKYTSYSSLVEVVHVTVRLYLKLFPDI